MVGFSKETKLAKFWCWNTSGFGLVLLLTWLVITFVQREPCGIQVSNEKRAPGCLGYIGDGNPTQLYRDYFINHEIRMPSLTNQDSMESKSVFFRGIQVEFCGFCCVSAHVVRSSVTTTTLVGHISLESKNTSHDGMLRWCKIVFLYEN